ncbi:MAG: protoporphyrinogen oxidase HemJ [Magnetospirillum sp. WYHS-4]
MSGEAYLWIKAWHLIAVMAWMAGLFYLPRLFVYHSVVEVGSEVSETFKVMERRLLRAIMNPAMVVTVALGVAMLVDLGWEAVRSQVWLHVKLTCAAGMLVMHWRMARWREDFAADRNTRPQRFYRIVNEVPTILMIAIVVMAIVKP